MTPEQEDKVVNDAMAFYSADRTRSINDAIRFAITSTRKQTLEEAAKVIDLKAHECWKNVSHEEYMNRIENAVQYDICRGEFKRLSAELRRMANEPISSPAATDSINADELSAARKEE
jgi:hypothetical protein